MKTWRNASTKSAVPHYVSGRSQKGIKGVQVQKKKKNIFFLKKRKNSQRFLCPRGDSPSSSQIFLSAFLVGLQRTCFKRGLPFGPLDKRRDVTKFAKNMLNRRVFHSPEIESVESGASWDQVSAPGNGESGNFENKEREGWLFHFLFSLFSRRTKKFCKNP